MLKSPKQRFIAAGVVVLIVAGVAGWWFFFRDDAPEEANIDDARATIEEEGSDAGADAGTSADAALDGTWTIDTSIGSFDDFSSTYAGYRIEEELASIGANTAVGRTPDVSGDIAIAGNQVSDGSFQINVATLQSDDGRRDNQMRGRGLETDRFPTATFTLTEPIDLPEGTASGDEVSFTATGDLTLHGVTNALTVEFDATLANGIIALTGSAPVTLADYQIEPPVGFSVVSVADQGSLEFQLFLSQS